jgi:hypothetical protein
MSKYNLGFISDEQIFEHTKETVLEYGSVVDLAEFNKNIIDPIKLTFDAKVYSKSFEEIIESECIRQVDKGNTNYIGFFHQKLFNYAGNGWYVPAKGFDVVNEDKMIYVEMKNKHNTMNSSSAAATYMKMLKQLSIQPNSTCLLVEAIAKHSQNIVWRTTVNEVRYEDERIRRVSMDKFYEIVFGDATAFSRLCKALPTIIDDVIKETHTNKMQNNVCEELHKISSDTFKSLYLLAFRTYEGFDNF